MPIENTDTLIVSGGQAGIALSEHLGNNNVPHIILEKNRTAEAWRTGRWELFANGPAWHNRFPSLGSGVMIRMRFSKDRVAEPGRVCRDGKR